MAAKTSYTAGHFELALDGAKTTSYLKQCDAPFENLSAINESIGAYNKKIVHAAVQDIEPISFEIGMAGAKHVLKWIQDSWRKNFSARNGQINHANFNLERVFEHEFSDALITETTFPALDGSSKEAAYLKVKFQPRAVATKKLNGGPKLVPQEGPKQKQWLCSGFRLNIDGLDDAKYCNKIEALTIKQSVKKLMVGSRRDMEIIPSKIEFPNLSGTISLAHADGFLRWHEEYVRKGKRDPRAQKTGSLEFLSPDKSKVLFRLNLYGLGLFKCGIQQSTANADQIKRIKFDMYVNEMDIDGGGSLGME
jgi:hypothetical protein